MVGFSQQSGMKVDVKGRGQQVSATVRCNGQVQRSGAAIRRNGWDNSAKQASFVQALRPAYWTGCTNVRGSRNT
jgi:hypothetical protein